MGFLHLPTCHSLCCLSYNLSFASPNKFIPYTQHTHTFPYRLCPHVVVMVALVCVNDPWGYAVKPLMPDRSKLKRRTRTVEVRFRDASVYQVSSRGRALVTCDTGCNETYYRSLTMLASRSDIVIYFVKPSEGNLCTTSFHFEEVTKACKVPWCSHSIHFIDSIFIFLYKYFKYRKHLFFASSHTCLLSFFGKF